MRAIYIPFQLCYLEISVENRLIIISSKFSAIIFARLTYDAIMTTNLSKSLNSIDIFHFIKIARLWILHLAKRRSASTYISLILIASNSLTLTSCRCLVGSSNNRINVYGVQAPGSQLLAQIQYGFVGIISHASSVATFAAPPFEKTETPTLSLRDG